MRSGKGLRGSGGRCRLNSCNWCCLYWRGVGGVIKAGIGTSGGEGTTLEALGE